jgi:hypothetical protein
MMEFVENYKNHEIYIQFLNNDWFRVEIKDVQSGKKELHKGFRTPHYMEVIEDVIRPMIDEK